MQIGNIKNKLIFPAIIAAATAVGASAQQKDAAKSYMLMPELVSNVRTQKADVFEPAGGKEKDSNKKSWAFVIVDGIAIVGILLGRIISNSRSKKFPVNTYKNANVDVNAEIFNIKYIDDKSSEHEFLIKSSRITVLLKSTLANLPNIYLQSCNIQGSNIYNDFVNSYPDRKGLVDAVFQVLGDKRLTPIEAKEAADYIMSIAFYPYKNEEILNKKLKYSGAKTYDELVKKIIASRSREEKDAYNQFRKQYDGSTCNISISKETDNFAVMDQGVQDILNKIFGINRDKSAGHSSVEDNDAMVSGNSNRFSDIFAQIKGFMGDSGINTDDLSVKSDVTFKDIGGQDEVIRTLTRKILFPIKHSEAFKKMKIEHGFVLYGPPGTGKTLLAEALSNESNAKFFKVNGSELSSKWYGETEENWRKVFKDAMDNQPSIIFIDEFDGIAKKRGGIDEFGSTILTQVLALISSIKKNDRVFVIAATNRLDSIDEAVIRSGRLGTHIKVDPPNTVEAIRQILDIHLRELDVDPNIDRTKLSNKLLKLKTTGADISMIVSEAACKSMERCQIYEKMEQNSLNEEDLNNLYITEADLNAAIEDFRNEKYTRPLIGFGK